MINNLKNQLDLAYNSRSLHRNMQSKMAEIFKVKNIINNSNLFGYTFFA